VTEALRSLSSCLVGSAQSVAADALRLRLLTSPGLKKPSSATRPHFPRATPPSPSLYFYPSPPRSQPSYKTMPRERKPSTKVREMQALEEEQGAIFAPSSKKT